MIPCHRSSQVWLRPTQPPELNDVLAAEQHPENAPYVSQWTLERHQQAISNPGERHWTVQTPAGFVGYILLNGLDRPDRVLELRRLVITNKRKGYGRQALMQVQRFAFETHRANRLWLDVKPNNQRARMLYVSMGFRAAETLDNGSQSPTEAKSLVVMSRWAQDYFSIDQTCRR